MENRFLNELTKFSPSETTYKFEKYTTAKDDKTFVVTENMYFNSVKGDLAVGRHTWDMHAVYHKLEMYKIVYVYSGSFILHTDGIPTYLEEGSLCIVPPNVLQKCTINYDQPDHDNMVLINFLIKASALSSVLATVIADKNPVSAYLTKTMCEKKAPNFMLLHTPGEFHKLLAEATYTEIRSIKKSGQSFYAPAYNLLSALILDYLRTDDTKITYAPLQSHSEDVIVKILQFIRANFQTVTLDDICQAFHYTPSYVCRLIRAHTKMSYKEYLTHERFDYICNQLISTNTTIKDIAAAAGYGSSEHFFRSFRKIYGITPQEFRNQSQKDRAILP